MHTTLPFQGAMRERFSNVQSVSLSRLALTLVIVYVFITVIVHCRWTTLIIHLFYNYSPFISLIIHLEEKKKQQTCTYVVVSAFCVAVATFLSAKSVFALLVTDAETFFMVVSLCTDESYVPPLIQIYASETAWFLFSVSVKESCHNLVQQKVNYVNVSFS